MKVLHVKVSSLRQIVKNFNPPNINLIEMHRHTDRYTETTNSVIFAAETYVRIFLILEIIYSASFPFGELYSFVYHTIRLTWVLSIVLFIEYFTLILYLPLLWFRNHISMIFVKFIFHVYYNNMNFTFILYTCRSLLCFQLNSLYIWELDYLSWRDYSLNA